jgi:hypothetical protein
MPGNSSVDLQQLANQPIYERVRNAGPGNSGLAGPDRRAIDVEDRRMAIAGPASVVLIG